MNITVTLTDDEVKCLENDLMDVQKWIEDAVKNKVENCKKRMIEENREKLMQSQGFLAKTVSEVNAIFADEKQVVSAIKALPDYKNRVQREQEERF